jgi:hypothetical protein
MAAAATPVFGPGLLGSLDDLAVRCAIIAISVPAGVFLLALAQGHRLFVEPPSHTGQPLLSVGMASYIVIPMVALTSAACAGVLAVTAGWSGVRSNLQVVRAAFLVTSAVLAILMAVVYDWYLLPDLLG